MKSLFYSLSLLLSFSLFLSCSEQNNKNSMKNNDVINVQLGTKEFILPLNYKTSEQKSKNRKLNVINYKLEFQIGSLEDSILYFPVRVKTDVEENIYILDQADCKVKKFSPMGKFIKSYGRKGEGPGETLRPMRLDVTPDSKILITDPQLHKCVIFIEDYSTDIKFNFLPTSSCYTSDSTIAVLQIHRFREYSHIEQYNLQGLKTLSFENILNLEEYPEIPGMITALLGEIISSANNTYFIPKFMNHIIAYDENGDLNFSVKTIDVFKNAPTTVMSSQSGKRSSVSAKFPDDQKSSINSGIFDEKIWIVSYQGLLEYSKKVFDFYSIKDGKYLYSYITDDIGKFMSIHMSNNRLFVIQPDGTIAVMKMVES